MGACPSSSQPQAHCQQHFLRPSRTHTPRSHSPVPSLAGSLATLYYTEGSPSMPSKKDPNKEVPRILCPGQCVPTGIHTHRTPNWKQTFDWDKGRWLYTPQPRGDWELWPWSHTSWLCHHIDRANHWTSLRFCGHFSSGDMREVLMRSKDTSARQAPGHCQLRNAGEVKRDGPCSTQGKE